MLITVAANENTQCVLLVFADAGPLSHALAVVLELRFTLAANFSETANALPLINTRTVTVAV